MNIQAIYGVVLFSVLAFPKTSLSFGELEVDCSDCQTSTTEWRGAAPTLLHSYEWRIVFPIADVGTISPIGNGSSVYYYCPTNQGTKNIRSVGYVEGVQYGIGTDTFGCGTI